MQPIIVTSGVDSEYVLGGLAEYLRANNCQVYEIDFGVTKADVRPLLERLSTSAVTYITSAHTNLTSRMARTFTPWLVDSYPNYLAPIEIMSILKPQVSLYVSHDLLSPFGGSNLDEFRFLDLFDHIIAPYECPELQDQVGPLTRVHDAGWIKYRSGLIDDRADIGSQVRASPSITFFISFIQHFKDKYGPHGIAQYFKPILKKGMRVKLPAWSGVEEIEEALRKHTDAEVVDSRCLSASLIAQSDLVLCNGASSIIAEAILTGVPGICILDDEAELRVEKVEKLQGFPELIFHDYSGEEIPQAVLDRALSQKLRNRLKAVDYAWIGSLVGVAKGTKLAG